MNYRMKIAGILAGAMILATPLAAMAKDINVSVQQTVSDEGYVKYEGFETPKDAQAAYDQIAEGYQPGEMMLFSLLGTQETADGMNYRFMVSYMPADPTAAGYSDGMNVMIVHQDTNGNTQMTDMISASDYARDHEDFEYEDDNSAQDTANADAQEEDVVIDGEPDAGFAEFIKKMLETMSSQNGQDIEKSVENNDFFSSELVPD